MSISKAILTSNVNRVAGLFLVVASAVQAAPITWDSPAQISGDSDISIDGALVGAYNLGGMTTTVNGVTFREFAVPSAPPAVMSVTVDTFYTIALQSFEHDPQTLAAFATSSANTPFSALSPGYQSLLGTSAGQTFGDRTTVLTMAGLTVGQTYEFQAWGNDSGSSGSFSYGLFLGDGITGSDLDPNTARDANTGDVVAGGLGQYILGTFTADTISQQIQFGRSELGGGLNAFQLRAITPLQGSVPEPGILLLTALGLAALGWSRRNHALV